MSNVKDLALSDAERELVLAHREAQDLTSRKWTEDDVNHYAQLKPEEKRALWKHLERVIEDSRG